MAQLYCPFSYDRIFKRICAEYAPNMLRIWAEYAPNLSRIWAEYAQEDCVFSR